LNNKALGIKISPLPGLLSLEVLFFAISYGWNKAKGTSYFGIIKENSFSNKFR